ncbi:MAG: O-methyltransferase [Planctomycetota bacterium]
MSGSSTLVTEKHFAYLAERTRTDDDFLRQLKAAAAAAGIPQIWVAPEQASFLQILLRLRGARDVVEVGTLAGYSSICMARALGPEGRVRTIEREAKHAAFARQWIAKSDVAGRVEVLEGDAREVLGRLDEASADACFIDADKENYPHYLEHAMRVLRPRGLLLVDNAFAFGELFDPSATDPSVHAVRHFNDLLAARADLHAVIVPLGDGCWVGAKLE